MPSCWPFAARPLALLLPVLAPLEAAAWLTTRAVAQRQALAVPGLEAELNEDGYLEVVKQNSDIQMEVFTRRVLRSLGLYVRDQGALTGLVPHFSGVSTSQTFLALKQELLSAAALTSSWLGEMDAPDLLHSSSELARRSFLAAFKTTNGSEAPLTESGYAAVARLKSDEQMGRFVQRTIESLGFHIVDMGRLSGVVPFYSGTQATQSFAQMRAEITGNVRDPEAWVTSGTVAALSEAGYSAVSSLSNDTEMGCYFRRAAHHFGCNVTDENGLKGVVPYYSGVLAVQSYASLSEEIRAACGLSNTRARLGSLHDAVGIDGVLQIRLDGSERYKYSAAMLKGASILPTEFSATNAHTASPDELRKSCPLASEPSTKSTCEERQVTLEAALEDGNSGCRSKAEQAITDSHRRALLAAQRRNGSDWTAIIEDDVVPLHPGFFDAAFKKAWANVPASARMVRLGWCSFEHDLGSISKHTYKDVGDFRIVKSMTWSEADGTEHYYTGGCTTGYLVHREILPELLGMFPCCCPIDCCLERQLFYTPTKPQKIPGMVRGEQILVNIDAWDSKEDSFNLTTFTQAGILVQDNRDLGSERPEWNKSDWN
jgi:hypothetical protein